MTSSLRDRVLAFVASQGQRVTAPMIRVVDAALDQLGTFSPGDIEAALQGEASRPTVYRTFTKMVQAGVLRQVTFNDRQVYVVIADD